MAFKVQNMNINPMNHTASVWFIDQYDPTKPAKQISVTFPFVPPPSEAMEQAKVVAAAKATLQQLLGEI